MKLSIYQCPFHREFWGVGIDEDDGRSGERLTPVKCCGSWTALHSWRLSADGWRKVAELAVKAAEEEDNRIVEPHRRVRIGKDEIDH
jgi:hypothetical protein